MGRLSSVACSPASITALPASPGILPSPMPGSAMLSSLKTEDCFSEPWLCWTLESLVLKPAPAASLMNTPHSCHRNLDSSTTSPTPTSVWQAGPLQPNSSGKCSSWPMCSLSFSVTYSLWSLANLSALSYLSHILVIIFCEKETDCKWWMRWAVTAQNRVSKGWRMWVAVTWCVWRGCPLYWILIWLRESIEGKGPRTHLNEIYITLARVIKTHLILVSILPFCPAHRNTINSTIN